MPRPTLQSIRRLGLCTLACMIASAATTQDAPGTARELLSAISAAESTAGPARLTLAVTERRGPYVPGEKLDETRKRLTSEPARESAGTLVFGSDGWLKEIAAAGAGGRTRTAETRGVLRIFVEGGVPGGGLGRISRMGTIAPGDSLLTRRVARAAAGIEWTALRAEGDRTVLDGTRGHERHTLALRRLPEAAVVSWSLVRSVEGPGGERLEQTYRCEVTPGENSGAISRIEEWVTNPPPVGNIGWRVTDVRKREPLDKLESSDVALKFPAGTVVTDTRGDVPIEYVETEAGVSEAEVAEKARALAAGRAKVGDAAPNIDFENSRGGKIAPVDYRGKVIVLIWVAADSTPAVKAAGPVRKLFAAYRKQGVQFLGLFLSPDADALKQADKFRKRSKWVFPMAVDREGEAQRRYGVEAAVPKVAIVATDGTLAYVRPGVDPAAVTVVLNSLLQKAARR